MIICTNCNQPIHLVPANTGEWIGDVATYYHANPKHCAAATEAATARKCYELAWAEEPEGEEYGASAISATYPTAFAKEEGR